MRDTLPITQTYNLARLGNAGDTVTFAADPVQCAAVARWLDVLSLQSLGAAVEIKKLSPDRFALDYQMTADVTQACVVTLEPVPAHLERRFSRELHFAGSSRRKAPLSAPPDIVLDAAEEEGPEEIESLHFELAGPLLEELVLALEPYPRRPGVEYAAPALASGGASERPQSPFAVLKDRKSGS